MSAKIKRTNTKAVKVNTGKNPTSSKVGNKKSSVVKTAAKKNTKPNKVAKPATAKKALVKKQPDKKILPKKMAIKSSTEKKGQFQEKNIEKQSIIKQVSADRKAKSLATSKALPLKAAAKIAKPKVAKIAKAKEKITAIAPLPKKVSKAKVETKAPTKAKQKTMTKADMMKLKDDVVFSPPISTMKIFGVEPYRSVADEEYMNEMQRSHFRQILTNWKKELMEEVDRTMVHMKDDAQRYADPNDIASQEEEFNLELRARDRERKLIRKIDSSLALIEQDEYGYCEACGIEIGIRRLEARPTADLCIDCKTLDEIREKQTKA